MCSTTLVQIRDWFYCAGHSSPRKSGWFAAIPISGGVGDAHEPSRLPFPQRYFFFFFFLRVLVALSFGASWGVWVTRLCKQLSTVLLCALKRPSTCLRWLAGRGGGGVALVSWQAFVFEPSWRRSRAKFYGSFMV